jgi:CheY-like chemotaxis protein
MSQSKLILVADDSEILRSLVMRQLERLGFHADAVGSGKDAVAAAERNDYALILMDCAMPDIDGFQATRLIREKEANGGRHTPIIAMTASAMSGDRELCIEAGMDDYFSKPFGLRELRDVLHQWIPGGGSDDAVATPAEASPNNQLPIEMEKLVEAYGPDGVPEMLQLFLQEMQGLLLEIADYLDKSDSDNLARVAHQVKGVSTFIVAERLRQVSIGLEQAARDREWERARTAYHALLEEYEDVTVFINKQLSGESA